MSASEEKPETEQVDGAKPAANKWGDDIGAHEDREKKPKGKLYKTIRAIFLLFCLMVVWFGYKYISYRMAQPKAAVNYLAVQDQEVLKVPAEQRGWPLYMQAIAGLNVSGFMQQLQAADLKYPEIMLEGSAHPSWHRIKEYLKEREEPINLFLEGTRKSHKGFLSHFSDPNYQGFAKAVGIWGQGPNTNNSYGYQMRSHLSAIYMISSVILPAALELAVEEQDHERATEILISWADLGMQIAETGAVNDEEGMGAIGMAIRPTMLLLTEHPDLLTDEELLKIQQKYEQAIKVIPRDYSLKHRQMLFDDFLERVYAGSSPEDSYLCSTGMMHLPFIFRSRFQGVPGVRGDFFQWLLPGEKTPASMAQSVKLEIAYMQLAGSAGTQAEISAKISELLELVKEDYAISYGDPLDSKLNPVLEEMSESSDLLFKYWIVLQLFNYNYEMRNVSEFGPSVVGVSKDGLKQSAFHQARVNTVPIAFALERYRRKNEKWPESLEQLVPEFLAEIPADPFGDQPMKYTLKDDQPFVYSVSLDGEDDQGDLTEIKMDKDGRHLKESDMIKKYYPGDIRVYPYQFVPF